jgi:hypothetical protein
MKKSELRKIIREIIIQEQGPRPALNKGVPQGVDMSWLGNPTSAQEAISNYQQLYNSNPHPNLPHPTKFIDDIRNAERKNSPWWHVIRHYGPRVVRWLGGLGALLWDGGDADGEATDP